MGAYVRKILFEVVNVRLDLFRLLNNCLISLALIEI